MNKYKFIVLLLAFLSYACRPPERKQEPIPEFNRGIYVLNEGNFQYGNSSISYIDEESGAVTNDLFFAVNQFPLGDVCQSMVKIGPYYYIAVNNSSKLEVVDTLSFRHVKTISGCPSPRYIMPVNNEMAYVTDLYGNAVYKLNLISKEITGVVSMTGWTEAMVKVDDEVYVSAPHNSYLFIMNALTHTKTDSVLIGYGVNSLLLDSEQNLWVLSGGDASHHQKAFMAKINPGTKSILEKVDFQENTSAMRLSANADNKTLYWIGEGGVYTLGIEESINNRQQVISGTNHNWYGLGVHPQNGELYLADAMDYVQRGKVYRYSAAGSFLDVYQTGIIPGGFIFK